MKESGIISFKKDAFTVEQINEKLNKGFILINSETRSTLIPEDIFNKMKSEFDEYFLLSEKIQFSAFNDYDINSDIPEFCSYLKSKSLKNLKTFIGSSTSNTHALRIMVKGIVEQPLYLVEALQQFPDTLPENEKYYFRQKWINDKLEFAKDKFTGYKISLENEIRELAATDPEKLKKSLNGLFLFKEQFISDLKQYQTEFKYLYSPLFKLFLNEIIYFKSYYLNEFGEFHFPEKKTEPPSVNLIVNTYNYNSEIISERKIQSEIISEKKSQSEISLPVWVLYMHYLQNAKIIPYFENMKTTKEQAIKDFLKEKDLSYSWKKFRNVFNSYGKGNGDDPRKIFYINKVIPLLENYPTAKKLAKNDKYEIEAEGLNG